MTEVTIIVAFIAGLVSFLAPCILPLIPGFLAYLAGSGTADAEANRKQIFLNSVFFVLGFSAVFSALGILLNGILSNIAYDVQTWLSRIGGIIIIFFGLYLMGLIKIKFLEQEHKIKVTKRFHSRYLTSFVFGSAFAVGWTPCVGAALGAIFGLAASNPGIAFWLLLSYSLGLGVPFLIVGLFSVQASHWIKKYAKATKWVNIIFGILLIGLGVLIFTQTLARIASFPLLQMLGELEI